MKIPYRLAILLLLMAMSPKTRLLAQKTTPKTAQLFNLGYDPSERTNVIDEFPEKAKELKALFDAFDGKKEN